MDAIEIVRGLLIPITAVATTVSLAWLKFYADARKRLDDLLFDLEHKLRDGAIDRTSLWMHSYPEIRKAAAEFERWIVDPIAVRRLRRAMERFRGSKISESEIFALRGTEHEKLIDTFLTNSETVCLAPHSYEEAVNRIPGIRRLTGSRRNPDSFDSVV